MKKFNTLVHSFSLVACLMAVGCSKKTNFVDTPTATSPVASTPVACAATVAQPGFCQDPAIRCSVDAYFEDSAIGPFAGSASPNAVARKLEVRLCKTPAVDISKRQYYMAEAFSYSEGEGGLKENVAALFVGMSSVLINNSGPITGSRPTSYRTMLTLPGVPSGADDAIYLENVIGAEIGEDIQSVIYLPSLGFKVEAQCQILKDAPPLFD